MGVWGRQFILWLSHPAAINPAKGVIPKFSTRALGEADSEQKTTTFGLPNQKCHLLAMPTSKTDILPERNEWFCITQALSHEAGNQSPL